MPKLRDTVSVAIQCPACPEVTEKPLPWLASMSSLFCPACGDGINLQEGDLHAFLGRLDQACAASETTAMII